jgi:hypothetical protein
MSDKTIAEFGAGRSSAWWRSRAKWVDSFEANTEWGIQASNDCLIHDLQNGRIFAKDLPDGIQERKQEFFDLIPGDKQYDIIVNDGIWRFEVLEWALNHFKGKGGILIADNWRQSGVWMSPPAEELMASYEINSYVQEDHTDNDGINKWKTVYWKIPK